MIFLESFSADEQFRCNFEDDGVSAWLYLFEISKNRIVSDAFVYNRIPPRDIREFEQYKNSPPPITKDYSTKSSMFHVVSEKDLIIKWANGNNAVVILYKNDPVSLIIRGEQKGYSKGVLKECAWGHPWNEKIYSRYSEY